jgi:hypothetical protein
MRRALIAIAVVVLLPAKPLEAADAGDPLAFKIPTVTGQDVRMKGYLFYDFENKNLYSTPRWEDAGDNCVPAAISDKLLKKAEKLNHSYVLVRGRTEDFFAAAPGKEVVSLDFCRHIGLVVESLAPAGKN